jgi:hypothetical protein
VTTHTQTVTIHEGQHVVRSAKVGKLTLPQIASRVIASRQVGKAIFWAELQRATRRANVGKVLPSVPIGAHVHFNTTNFIDQPLPGVTTVAASGTLVLGVEANGATAPTVTSSTLGSWGAPRATYINVGLGNWEFEWTIAFSSALTNEVITYNDSSGSFFTFDVVELMGATAFDPNVSLPVNAAATPANVSTTGNNTLILAFIRDTTGPIGGLAGAGWNLISGLDYHVAQYVVASSPQTNLAITLGGGQNSNGLVCDAFVLPSSPTIYENTTTAKKLSGPDWLPALRAIVQTTSLSRATAKGVTIAAVEVILLLRTTLHFISTVNAGVMIVVAHRTVAWSLSATSSSVVALATQRLFGRVFSFASAETTLLARGVAHGIALASSEVVLLARASAHFATIAWSSAQSLVRSLNVGKLVTMARTNVVPNSTMVGAVVGSPGTLPAGWISGAGAGITVSVVGLGSINGVPYIDINYAGTLSVTTNPVGMFFDGGGDAVAANGQIWTSSFYSQVLVGDPNVTVVYNSIQFLTSGGGDAGGDGQGGNILSGTFVRNIATVTASSATTAFTRSFFYSSSVNSGTAVNFTIRVAGPQLEQSPFATALIPTAGAAVTAYGMAPIVGWMTLVASVGGAAYTQAISWASTQAVSFAKAVGRQVALIGAEAVLLTKFVAHGITVALANAMVVVARHAAQVPIGFASSSAVALARAMGKLISWIDAEALALVKGVGKSPLLFASPERTLLNRGSGKSFAFTEGQAIVLSRSTAKIVSMVLVGAVALNRATTKLFAFASALVTTLVKMVAKVPSATINENVKLARAVGKLVTLTSGEILTLARAVAKTAVLVLVQGLTLVRSVTKTFSFVSTETVTLIRGAVRLRVLSFAEAAGVALVRQTGKVLTPAISQVVSLSRAIGKLIVFVSAQIVVLILPGARHLTLLAVSPSAVLLARGVVKTFALPAAQVVALARNVGKVLAASISSFVRLARYVGVVVSLATVQFVIVSRAVGRACSMTIAETIVLTRNAEKTLIFRATSAVVLAVVHGAARALSLSTPQIIALARGVVKLVSFTTSLVALLSRVFSRFVTVTSRQVVTLIAAVPQSLLLTLAPLTQTIVRSARLGKAVYASLVQVVSVTLSLGEALLGVVRIALAPLFSAALTLTQLAGAALSIVPLWASSTTVALTGTVTLETTALGAVLLTIQGISLEEGMDTYAVETTVRLSAAFTDLNSNPIDPTTVTVELTDPTNTVNTVTDGIIRDGVGLYHYDWTGDAVGFWFIRYQGTGAVTAANLPVQVKLV